jgi:ribosomal protein L12E/L44/L45/RPP1/RPP2
MVTNAKSTRNADLRHAQAIGRQRQAAQRAAADVSPQDLADILPHDESPILPVAAPVTASADEAPADTPRPSWRDREPAVVHSVRWRDSDHHEHLHIVRGDDLDEVLLHLKKVKAAIAAARARDGAGDSVPASEELPQCRQVRSALHRGADDPEAAPYCHEHETRFFRNVWKNGRVSWSHRKADGSGFCRYKG